MKRLIQTFAIWLLKKTGANQHGICAELMAQAEKQVIALAGKGPSGEYRRHQALAALMKAGWRERDAALAIELAVRNVSA